MKNSNKLILALVALAAVSAVSARAAVGTPGNENCAACQQLARASSPSLLNFSLPTFSKASMTTTSTTTTSTWNGQGDLPGSAPQINYSAPALTPTWSNPFFSDQAGAFLNPYSYGNFYSVFGVPVFVVGQPGLSLGAPIFTAF